MARIRTIKPEFWTDDLMGALSREARLLFIGSWNLADDEGLLRWTAPYLKGAVFPFDDDIDVATVTAYMAELTGAGIVFAYRGGRSQQALAYIVNFQRHQKINRPSPSKLPAPSIQSMDVKNMYGQRDGWVCHLCNGSIDHEPPYSTDDFMLSLDHVHPQSQGGSDYPSNIKASHQSCNKGRRDRTIEEYRKVLSEGRSNAQLRHPERFTHLSDDRSLNNSLSDSVPEREGEREQGREEERKASHPGRHEKFGEVIKRVESILNCPTLTVFADVDQWLKGGADPDMDIYPTLERLKSKWSGPSLKYFTQAIADSVATRKAPMPAGVPRFQGRAQPAGPTLTADERAKAAEQGRQTRLALAKKGIPNGSNTPQDFDAWIAAGELTEDQARTAGWSGPRRLSA